MVMFSSRSALCTPIFISNFFGSKKRHGVDQKGSFYNFFKIFFQFYIFALHLFLAFVECSGRRGKQNCSGATCVYRLRQIKGAANHFSS